MRGRIALTLALAASMLVGCGGGGGGAGPGAGPDELARIPRVDPADRDGLDEIQMERFETARSTQDAALAATLDLVDTAEDVDIETLEAGLRTLNDALVRARTEVGRLRSEKPEGYKDLMIELRSVNREIKKAYDTMLAHHPEPTPERLGHTGA